MAQHVSVDLKRKTCFLPCPLDHPIKAVGREGPAALAYEHEWRLWCFPFEPSQRSERFGGGPLLSRCAMHDWIDTSKLNAYHEAGHVVVAAHRGGWVRHVQIAPCCETTVRHYRPVDRAIVALAGPIVQMIVHPCGTSGCDTDRRNAREVATRMSDDPDKFLKWALHIAANVLSVRWPDVESVAGESLWRGALTGDRLDVLLGWPPFERARFFR